MKWRWCQVLSNVNTKECWWTMEPWIAKLVGMRVGVWANLRLWCRRTKWNYAVFTRAKNTVIQTVMGTIESAYCQNPEVKSHNLSITNFSDYRKSQLILEAEHNMTTLWTLPLSATIQKKLNTWRSRRSASIPDRGRVLARSWWMEKHVD